MIDRLKSALLAERRRSVWQVLAVYGIIAFTVVHRTRELGLRISLGAEGSPVLRLVLRQNLTVTLLGLVLGMAGAGRRCAEGTGLPLRTPAVG
jgi:hypothetical protein